MMETGRMTMASIYKTLLAAASFVVVFWASSSIAIPSMFNDVDFIDAVFSSGGGTLSKSLTSGADDGWMVFTASAGDNITVQFSSNSGSFEGAVMFDVVDGIVQVNDLANIVAPFVQFAGANDLQIQHGAFNGPGYNFGGPAVSLNMPIITTGQYVIGVTCQFEVCQGGSIFKVSLSGNTASPIPEPATLAIFTLGLLGLGAARRHKAARRP